MVVASARSTPTLPSPWLGAEMAAARSPAGEWRSSNLHGCPCGMTGDPEISCVCPPGSPERYARRVSGPLRDRIDLWVTMPRVPPAALLASLEPERSVDVASRIAACRRLQVERCGRLNARIRGRALRGAARMGRAEGRRPVALSELE